MITGSQIEEFLTYDPRTGILIWKKQVPRTEIMPGAVAGSRDDKGYVRIGFLGREYKAHHFAWVYMNGEWPRDHLDHINGDRSDNRIANLRLATPSQNLQNRGATKLSRSGFKGVYWHNARQKWRASIKIGGKTVHLGSFDNPKEAHAAYCEAARSSHGEFARFV